MDPTESPTIARFKTQIDNVSPSYTESRSMVAAQVAFTTEQLVAKGISTHVAKSLEEVMPCTYHRARTEVCSVFYTIFMEILLDLLKNELMDEVVDKRITNYLDTRDASDNFGEKLLSTNAFNAPFAAFIKRRTGEDVPAERITTKIETADVPEN